MNIWKLLLTWPYFLKSITKAKKLTKRLFRDPNIDNEEYRYKWFQKKTKYLLWLHSIKIIPHGYKNWPNKNCLIVSNHQNNLDPVIFMKLNHFSFHPPCAFIAKKELLEKKITRRFLYLIDILFLDRNNPRQGIKVLKEAIEIIRTPRSMILFPEGTRSNSKNMNEFKSGLISIAQKSHSPIIPVSVVNSHQFSRKLHFWKPKGIQYIHVVFHKPIKESVIIQREKTALIKKVQSTIQTGLDAYQDMSHKESKLMYKKYRKSLKKKDN